MRAYPTFNRAHWKTATEPKNGIIQPVNTANAWPANAPQDTQTTRTTATIRVCNAANAKINTTPWATRWPARTCADARLHRACTRAKNTRWMAANVFQFVTIILMKQVP